MVLNLPPTKSRSLSWPLDSVQSNRFAFCRRIQLVRHEAKLFCSGLNRCSATQLYYENCHGEDLTELVVTDFRRRISKLRIMDHGSRDLGSIAKRMRAMLAAIKQQLRARMHRLVGETGRGRWLRSVIQGWLNYHAVPGNSIRLDQFATEVRKL